MIIPLAIVIGQGLSAIQLEPNPKWTVLEKRFYGLENEYKNFLRYGTKSTENDQRVNQKESAEFESIAVASGKKSPALKAWTLALISGQKDLARENRILDHIFAFKSIDEGQFNFLDQWCQGIGRKADTYGASSRVPKVLDFAIEKAPTKEEGASLLFKKADFMPDTNDLKWDIYNRLVEQYAGTKGAKFARSRLLEKKNLRPGNIFPDFISKDSDGKKFQLTDLRGKVVVLEFWANWCPSCQRTIPVMQGVEKQFAGQPVEFVGVNSDGDAPVVKELQAKWGMTTRTLVDGSPSGPISVRYAIMAWPSFFVIGKDGKVVYRSAGIDANGMTAAIKEASK